MIDSIRQAFELLDKKTRRQLPFLIGSFALVAAFDALSIGLVFPLMLALVDPQSVERIYWLSSIADMLGADDQRSLVISLGLIIACLFIFKNTASALLVRWQFRIVFAAESDVGVRLLDRYLRSPWQLISQRNSSELIRNASVSTSHVFLSFVIPTLTLLVEAGLAVAVLTTLLIIDPLVAAVSFGLVTVASLAYFLIVRRGLAQVGSDFQSANFRLLNHLKQGIGAGREIRILGRTEEFIDRLRDARELYAHAQAKRAILMQLPRYYLETVLVVVVIAAIWVILLTRSMSEAAAILALFGVAALRLMASANRILSSAQQIRIGLEPLSIVYNDLHGSESGIHEAQQKQAGSVERQVGGIELRSVSHSYVNDELVLSGVDIHIPWGSSIGIVGPSGSGKSTLIDVILGLLPPLTGVVRVDGQDIRSDLKNWQSRIGYVPQTIYLTDDTLRNNIAFGLPDGQIDDAAVLRAVHMAQLDEFLADLPNGLETVVGEMGSTLSGGQRQRVGIARALYHDPDVLLLDEATSALDNEAENAVVSAVEALKEQKTVVVVAHRLSTVRRCDCLFFLERGKVTDHGSFDELKSQSKSFARLVELGEGNLTI